MKRNIYFISIRLPALLPFQLYSMVTTGRLAIKHVITVFAGICFFSGVAIGAEHKSSEHEEQAEHRFSDRYVMEVDPAAKRQLGEDIYNEIVTFFNSAEDAIEKRDLKALLDLYSDNYKDGDKDKKSVEEIWTRIFARFETLITHHKMKLVNVSADKHMVIFRCSGLLLAEPEPKKGLVTIDNWALQDHVLVNEAGKWKLIGTYGTERKRLWFDKPMHPLF